MISALGELCIPVKKTTTARKKDKGMGSERKMRRKKVKEQKEGRRRKKKIRSWKESRRRKIWR